MTAAAVEGMKPGSVVVDLAGETGGNCELTEPGQTVVHHDVTIASPLNLPATMPEHASELYSKNITALLELLLTDGELAPDFDDEVHRGVVRDARGTEMTGILDVRRAVGQPGDPGAVRVRRVRGDFQGAQHAAHAADVGHQRDPRHRGARRAGVFGSVEHPSLAVQIILFVAVVFGTLNVIGGFIVTDRMLGMFKGKKKPLPGIE